MKLDETMKRYNENCLTINEQRAKITQFTHKHGENEKLVAKLEQQLSENAISYSKKITESELIIKQVGFCCSIRQCINIRYLDIDLKF